MAVSLGDHYQIPRDAFDKTGALDPILGVDTRLFIDPSLLRHTTIPELCDSYPKLSQHFVDVLKVVKHIGKEGDAFWRQADRMLTFPEVQGLCIGYSAKGVAGRGAGREKRRRLLATITQLVQAGCDDPSVFELVGAFEEGIGPDLISDMVAKIIMPDLIAFTQRACSELGLPMEPLVFAKRTPPEDLPFNPSTKAPIILVPMELLRDLPVADTFADIFWIAEHNQKLRDEFNMLVGGSLRTLTPGERKARVRDAFAAHPDALAQVLEAYEREAPRFYDFRDDPAGETIWYRVSRDLPHSQKLELSLPQKPTLDEVHSVVRKICDHFRRLVEDNQLARLLYDRNGYRKHESASQLLFFGIAQAYCEANDLDLSPESDGGRGPVDFKVSAGFTGKVLVEVKLTSNQQLLHGYQKQLPIYQQAESSQRGVYLVINNGGVTKARWQAFSDAVQAAGPNGPEVVVIDGSVRQSASKAAY